MCLKFSFFFFSTLPKENFRMRKIIDLFINNVTNIHYLISIAIRQILIFGINFNEIILFYLLKIGYFSFPFF